MNFLFNFLLFALILIAQNDSLVQNQTIQTSYFHYKLNKVLALNPLYQLNQMHSPNYFLLDHLSPIESELYFLDFSLKNQNSLLLDVHHLPYDLIHYDTLKHSALYAVPRQFDNRTALSKLTIIDGDFQFTDVSASYQQELIKDQFLYLAYAGKSSLSIDNFSPAASDEKQYHGFWRGQRSNNLSTLFFFLLNESNNRDVLVNKSDETFIYVKDRSIKKIGFIHDISSSIRFAINRDEQKLKLNDLDQETYHFSQHVHQSFQNDIRIDKILKMQITAESKKLDDWLSKKQNRDESIFVGFHLKLNHWESEIDFNLKDSQDSQLLKRLFLEWKMPSNFSVNTQYRQIKPSLFQRNFQREFNGFNHFNNRQLNVADLWQSKIVYMDTTFNLSFVYTLRNRNLNFNPLTQTFMNDGQQESAHINSKISLDISRNLKQEIKADFRCWAENDPMPEYQISARSEIQFYLFKNCQVFIYNSFSFLGKAVNSYYLSDIEFFYYDHPKKSDYLHWQIQAIFRIKKADIVFSMDNPLNQRESIVNSYNYLSRNIRFGIHWTFLD